MKFFRYCMTLRRRACLLGARVGIAVVVLSGIASGQDAFVRITNETYTYRTIEAEGSRLFVVDGFTPDQGAPASIPVRVIRLQLPSPSSLVMLRRVEYGGTYAAWPYFSVGFSYAADSTLAARYIPRRDAAEADSVPRIIAMSTVHEQGVIYADVEVPLLAFDGRRGEVRWIRAYSFEFVSGDAAAPTAGLAAIPPYASQPFIRKSRDLDTSGAWIDRSGAMLRFHVKRDGVYRLTKSWFAQAGIDITTFDPASLRLVRKGAEVPLLAEGLDDGRFDENDAFLFYGQRRYDDGGYRFVPRDVDDPCPEYINKYGDSTAYWISFTGSGTRIPTQADPAPLPRDTVDWAFELIHSEADNFLFAVSTDPVRQQVSDWTSDKTWFNTWLGTSRAAFTFTTDRVKQGPRAKLFQKSGSWTAPTSFTPNHKVTVALNGGPVLDSVIYDVNRQGLVAARGLGDDIKEGNNLFEIRNVKFYEGDNVIYLDWFDVEYPRYLTSRGAEFSFTADEEMGSGTRLFHVTGLSAAAPVILRMTGGNTVRISPLSVSATAPYSVVFADTVRPGARYVLAASDSIPVAPPARQRGIVDLRASAEQASYVLVTAAEFLAEAREYAAFIESSYSEDTRVVAIEDVYDNYSFGMFNPEALKVFLFDARNTWTQKAPKWIFLVGDANYNYKAQSTPQSQNFVPTYGFPASDVWFTCFDEQSMEPSIAIGRITAHSGSDVLLYRDKHARMLAQTPDPWNKTSLHFSGGTSSTPQEKLDELRRINEAVIREAVQPAPFGGTPVHFYKTKTPPTDFGPFSDSYIREKIEDGGIIISYIGHAAIRTWDNTIGDPSQLYNRSGRASLVSDFGCSTSKFADPDGSAFAELFVVPEGTQAIGYIGNAAIGFTSTAAIMPVLFYKALLRDGYTSIGEAHRISKREMLRQYGGSTVNRSAILSNTLIGDPIARLPIAKKPNLVARPQWVRPGTDIFTNAMDTLVFSFTYANLGVLRQDSVTLIVRDEFAGTVRAERRYRRALPALFDTIRVQLPGGDAPGAHVLRIRVDADDEIDEESETDNHADYPFTVLSTYLQAVNATLTQTAGAWLDAAILNPTVNPGEVTSLAVEFDTSDGFTSPARITVPYMRTVSPVSPPAALPQGARVSWRAKLDLPSGEFAGPFRYWNLGHAAPFMQRDSAEFAALERHGTLLTRTGFSPAAVQRSLQVIGSGFNDGNYGTVALDGKNLLPTTFGRGYYVVVIDSVSIVADTIAAFDTYDNPAECRNFAAFIQRQPFGKILAISTMDDPFAYSPELPVALKSIGARHADTLLNYDAAYRGNYAIIGRRGAASGTVLEGFRLKFQGRVRLDTAYTMDPDTATIVSPFVGPASAWKLLRLERSPVAESDIGVRISGRQRNGRIDTLLNAANPDSVNLASIDANVYPHIRFEAVLVPRKGAPLPQLQGWSVDYIQRSELAVNYQSVSIVPDSVEQGEPVSISLGIVNAGEADAGAFSVAVESTGPDNIRRSFAAFTVPGLGSRMWFDTSITVQTASFSGRQNVAVHVDRDDAVPEQYETNNSYITRLLVLRDTLPPVLDVLFDGQQPPDGDYVRPSPLVTLRLNDASPIRVGSASAFSIYLDDSSVSTAGLSFIPMTPGKPAELTYVPVLTTGEHEFRFNARDASGNAALEDDLRVRVLVDTDSRILSLTNYPNPFTENTAFLFTLTGETQPERIEIKLYTVAGRLIRKIEATDRDLRIGQNMIRWDGRDEDGDLLANGVYFYKFTVHGRDGARDVLGRVAKLQ